MLQFIKQHPNTQFLDEDLKRAIDLQLGQMEKKQIKKISLKNLKILLIILVIR